MNSCPDQAAEKPFRSRHAGRGTKRPVRESSARGFALLVTLAVWSAGPLCGWCAGRSQAGRPSLSASNPPIHQPVALPAHPFVLVDTNELAALRADLARPGWKRQVYLAPRGFSLMNTGRGIRPNADHWLNRPIVIPARGGHYHNLFCDDGDRLALPPDQEFVPGPYRCPKCGRTYRGERYEEAVRRLVHGWLAQAALDLALVGQLEHKPEYADQAAEILLRYAAVYPGPHTTATEGGMIYQSLDESMWVIPLAQAYDLIYDRLAKADRATIANFLRTVAGGIRQCGTRGNWGSWHLSAVGVVGYATGDADLIEWATRSFQEQIRDQLGDDGLWPESVHTYHYFPLNAFLSFADAAWHAGVDLYRWEGKPGKSLARMLRAPLEYAYPDLRLPAINDGWFESFVPPDGYELGWRRLRDPHFAWVIARGYRADAAAAGAVPDGQGLQRDGLYAFLFGGEVPADTQPPDFRSINFPVLGICELRSTNGAVLTFDYGPMLGHGQLDKMGITLFANSRLWFADYGTPGYGAPILPWYKSTFAHNTVVVDGRNQQATRENAARLWLDHPDVEAAEAETREAYPGVRHTRTVVRVGDCFVIRDTLQSATRHQYDFYLHGEGELSLDAPGRPQRASHLPGQWIEGATAHPPRETITGCWRKGGDLVAFWLVGDGPITPITARCPAESGSRKIPLLIARRSGTNAAFLAVLQPFRGQGTLRVERRGDRLEFRGPLEGVLTLPEEERGPDFAPRRSAMHQRPAGLAAAETSFNSNGSNKP